MKYTEEYGTAQCPATCDTHNTPVLSSEVFDIGYDKYYDKNSLIELMRGIQKA